MNHIVSSDLSMKAKPVEIQDSFLINKVQVNNNSHKSFSQVLTGSRDKKFDIPISQLSRSCIKGDELVSSIPEEEYAVGLKDVRHTFMVGFYFQKDFQKGTLQ